MNETLNRELMNYDVKELRKKVIKKARLRNAYLKIQTEATKAAYNY